MMPRVHSKLISIGAALALVLAGCGGGGHKSSSSSSTSSSATSSGAKKGHGGTTGKSSKANTLSELIAVSKSGKSPSSTATASPGDNVQFITHVPGKAKGPPTKVHVDFFQASPTKLTVTTSANKQSATGTITSKNGKPIKISELRYTCALPPAPTFCPAHNVNVKSPHIKADFSATSASPVSLAGLIGPVSTAPPKASKSTLVAPTYNVTTTLLARAPTASKSAAPAKPSSSAQVHPGDSLLIRVAAAGTIVGATQPLTLTMEQGPGTSLAVSAGVPGGTLSKATVTSATGKPVDIILPRYGCVLPPAPTFCPPESVKAASHKYIVTFGVTPQTSPVTIKTKVQAG